MYQTEMARFGKTLFVIRGVYIYATLIIGVVISWAHKDLGPFADPEADRLWFWIALLLASLGALIRIKTSGHAALGTSGRVKAAAKAAELNRSLFTCPKSALCRADHQLYRHGHAERQLGLRCDRPLALHPHLRADLGI